MKREVNEPDSDIRNSMAGVGEYHQDSHRNTGQTGMAYHSQRTEWMDEIYLS